MIFYDKDGNEVQAFSAEELESQKQAAIAEEKAKAEAAAAEAEKLKNKDHNFETLKSSLTQKEQEIEALKKTTQESEALRISEIRKEVLKSFTGDDADLVTKLEEEMKNFRGEPKTKDEMITLAQKAMSIIKPDAKPGAFDMIGGGGRVPSGDKSGNSSKISEPVKGLGNKMGLSDKDFEKYGN